MVRGFVSALLDVVLLANFMAVGGAEPALDPHALYNHLELHNATVKYFSLFGSDGVVGGAGDAVVVLSSNGGKGRFNLREEFLDFAVLARGGPRKMVKRPFDDLVTVCGCGRQVVEMGVNIVGQVSALGENAGFSVEWGRVGCRDDVVDELRGGRRSKLILSPLEVCLALEIILEGVESVLPGPPRMVEFRFPVPLREVVGKGVRDEEGGRVKCREQVVGDWKAVTLGLFLCLLYRHDELGNLGVDGPVAREFSN